MTVDEFYQECSKIDIMKKIFVNEDYGLRFEIDKETADVYGFIRDMAQKCESAKSTFGIEIYDMSNGWSLIVDFNHDTMTYGQFRSCK